MLDKEQVQIIRDLADQIHSDLVWIQSVDSKINLKSAELSAQIIKSAALHISSKHLKMFRK